MYWYVEAHICSNAQVTETELLEIVISFAVLLFKFKELQHDLVKEVE
jgi:hypothetical protein